MLGLGGVSGKKQEGFKEEESNKTGKSIKGVGLGLGGAYGGGANQLPHGWVSISDVYAYICRCICIYVFHCMLPYVWVDFLYLFCIGMYTCGVRDRSISVCPCTICVYYLFISILLLMSIAVFISYPHVFIYLYTPLPLYILTHLSIYPYTYLHTSLHTSLHLYKYLHAVLPPMQPYLRSAR